MRVFSSLLVIFALIWQLSGQFIYFSNIYFHLIYSFFVIPLANHISSGTLKLIIKTYINDLLESSQVIDEILKTKLAALG